MRILKNQVKVFGFDELSNKSKKIAIAYFNKRKKEENQKGKNYFYTVNDFEFFKDGGVVPYTNDIMTNFS